MNSLRSVQGTESKSQLNHVDANGKTSCSKYREIKELKANHNFMKTTAKP